MRTLLVALALPIVSASAARAQEPTALLPPGARAVVAADDVPAFWERLRATRLYAALSALPKAREEVAEETGLDEAAWVALFGGRAATGFYGELKGDRHDVIAVAEIADRASARAALAALEAQFAARRGVAFVDDEHGGTPLRVARDTTGAEVAVWALAGERFVAGSNRSRVAEVLDRAAGRAEGPSMAVDPEYAGAERRLEGATIVLWLDTEALADELPATRRAAFARWLALGLRWTEGGLRGDAYLALGGTVPPEIVALAATPPAPIRSTAFLPASTLVAFATAAFDAPTLVAGLRRAGAASGDSLAADSLFAARVAAWEAKTGIDVEGELAPAIGGEVALALVGVDRSGPMFPVPLVAAAIEVRDEAKALAVLEKLERWTTEELRQKRSIPLAWQTEPYQGTTIRYAPTPFGERLEAAYAVAQGFALFGSSRGVVRGILDVRAGRAPSLDEGPGFAAMSGFFPDESSGLTYLDLAGLAREVAEAARAFGWIGQEDENVAALLEAVENAPRLGIYAEPDPESGVWWRGLLEVR